MNKTPDQKICVHIVESLKNYPGLVRLDKVAAENALDRLSKDKTIFNGIKITNREDLTIIDVYVVVEFGTQIPKFAWELQKKVQEETKEFSGKEIDEINIHIEGVSL